LVLVILLLRWFPLVLRHQLPRLLHSLRWDRLLRHFLWLPWFRLVPDFPLLRLPPLVLRHRLPRFPPLLRWDLMRLLFRLLQRIP